jgi:hypothetical protein
VSNVAGFKLLAYNAEIVRLDVTACVPYVAPADDVARLGPVLTIKMVLQHCSIVLDRRRQGL